MFTGIVEETGMVVRTRRRDDSLRLVVDAPGIAPGAAYGESVAVDGVCLTVAEHRGTELEFDVMGETLDRSTLGRFGVGWKVNLERPLRADGRLDGHVVQGHVDTVVTVHGRQDCDGWRVLRFDLPTRLARFLVEKGSVAVAGTSLTVSAVSEPGAPNAWFEVSLIPTTLRDTTLGDLQVGDRVNLEVDVMAKYLLRAAAFDAAPDARGVAS